jgi:hypothetical protein
MPKTYAQIMDDAEAYLQDTGNGIFSTTELDLLVPGVLARVSQSRPWKPNQLTHRYSSSQTVSAKDVVLTAGDKWRLAWVDKVEYPVGMTPPVFRNFSRNGDVVSIGITHDPAAEAVYLYLAKVHILQKAIGTSDTAGAIKTQAAVGATTLAMKSLGTGTVNEDTKLTIAGDTTVYHVIETATIGTNEATVTIWPALEAVATADAIVTLSLADSTLEFDLEDLVSRYIAARAAVSKAGVLYQQAQAAIASVTLAATAYSAVAARITQAVTDAASGRTKAGELAALITSARAEIDLINPEVDQAVADLDTARPLLGSFSVGNQGAQYQNQAQVVLSSALGYAHSADALIKQAQATGNGSSDYLQVAGRELQAASVKMSEGSAQLQASRTQLSIAQAGRSYEQWGLREKAEVERELDKRAERRRAYDYPVG